MQTILIVLVVLVSLGLIVLIIWTRHKSSEAMPWDNCTCKWCIGDPIGACGAPSYRSPEQCEMFKYVPDEYVREWHNACQEEEYLLFNQSLSEVGKAEKLKKNHARQKKALDTIHKIYKQLSCS